MRTTIIRAAVVFGALSALGAVGVAVSTVDSSDRPAAIDDTPGRDPLEGDRATRIPAARVPEERHGCGSLPVAFDNTEAGYSLCYPQGHGFLSLTDAAPLSTLDALEAASVRLADASAFPWTPGTLPLDAVANGATIIEITTLPSFTPSSEAGDCTPRDALGSNARVCSIVVDPMSASPSPSGSVLELLSVHELTDRVAVVRSYLPADASAETQAQIRSILATIRALPTGAVR